MTQDIVFVTISLAGVAGGLERNITSIANHVSSKFNVHLVTFDWPHVRSFYEISDIVQWHKIATSEPHKRIGFLKRLQLLIKLRGVLRNARDPIIVVFHHGILLRVLLSRFGISSTLVVSERNSISLYEHVSTFKWNANFLALYFAKIITVQFDSYASDYPKILRNKITAIPNAISPKLFVPREQKKIECHEKKQILAVGRLCSQKRFEDLIYAFGALSEKHQNWSLKILGDGELKEKFLALIDELDLNGRVILQPSIIDVAAHYEEADIFCSTSKWEGFPNALAEAMAKGLAVIGYEECAGVNQLIHNSINGILVPRESNNACLTSQLDALMADQGLRQKLGRCASESVRKYSEEFVLPNWLSLFSSMQSGEQDFKKLMKP